MEKTDNYLHESQKKKASDEIESSTSVNDEQSLTEIVCFFC